MTTYRLHGLTFESSITLPAEPSTDRRGDADVRLRLAEGLPGVPDDGPELLLDHRIDGRRWYAAARIGREILFELPGCARFRVSPHLDEVLCEPTSNAAVGLLPVMLAGNVIAFLLALRGWPVLHAAAVEVEGEATAIVGASGMGKSTLATMLCGAGARLVTDDVLRVELGRGRVYRGGPEVRLRPKAARLARGYGMTAPPRATADGRTAASPQRSPAELLPLTSAVIPRPRRDIQQTEVRRLPRPDAAMALLSVPRTLGWRDPAPIATHFRAATALAAKIPVYVADIPWGPPFRPEVARVLLDEIAARNVSVAATQR